MGKTHSTRLSLTSPVSYCLLAAIAVFALSGCVRLTPAYITGSNYKRATILYEEGLLIDARETAERVEKSDPNYESAKLLITKIRSISVKVAKDHMEIAEEFEKAGLYKSAIAAYEDSLRFNPKNDYVLNRIASLKGNLLQQTEGLANNNQASADRGGAELASKASAESKINLRYLKGKAHLENEDYPKAIEELTAVLIKSPSHKDARKLLDQARAELKAAVSEHLKMGSAYFQNEQMELALEEWEAVLELDPENKTARDYRARAKTIIERLEKIKGGDGR